MSRVPTQIPLQLPHRALMSAEDFLVTESNRLPAEWLARWPDWPVQPVGRVCLLLGPAGSGKSHLAHIHAARADAAFLSGPPWKTNFLSGPPPQLVLEDYARCAHTLDGQTQLFHLLNQIREGGGSLLLTGREAPAATGFTLPDLLSRLKAAPTLVLAPPDDALLAGLLLKAFSDRQVRVSEDVLDYLIARGGRSAQQMLALVEKLDRAALVRAQAITVPLARKILEEGER